MGGKASRDKGGRGERELVHIFQDHGIPARRVPLSGAMSGTGFGGDVLVTLHCDAPEDHISSFPQCGGEERIEVKRRGSGFVQIDKWLDDNYALCFRSDRKDWNITLRLEDFLKAIAATREE